MDKRMVGLNCVVEFCLYSPKKRVHLSASQGRVLEEQPSRGRMRNTKKVSSKKIWHNNYNNYYQITNIPPTSFCN